MYLQKKYWSSCQKIFNEFIGITANEVLFGIREQSESLGYHWQTISLKEITGIGSPTRNVGLWAVPVDKQKPKDGQRDHWAWVNGPRTKEKNNVLSLISEEPGHLGRALER